MKKIKCFEIENGLLTGNIFISNEEFFILDIKKCAKTHIKEGYNIYVDSLTFTKIKTLCEIE